MNHFSCVAAFSLSKNPAAGPGAYVAPGPPDVLLPFHFLRWRLFSGLLIFIPIIIKCFMQSSKKPVIKCKKTKIPAALREQVWLSGCGRVYESKCTVGWCENVMTVHDFHCGHNVPESRGGETLLSNLVPICARCNLSMGNAYTVNEWKGIGLASQKTNNSNTGPKATASCWACIMPIQKKNETKNGVDS